MDSLFFGYFIVLFGVWIGMENFVDFFLNFVSGEIFDINLFIVKNVSIIVG